MNNAALRFAALSAFALVSTLAYACWEPQYLPQDYLTYQVIEREYSDSYRYDAYDGNEPDNRVKPTSPRQAMVSMWQKQLLPAVSAVEIDSLIFDDGMSLDQIRSLKVSPRLRSLLTADDNTLLDYVLTMREVADIRNIINDPWYYCNKNNPIMVRLRQLAHLALDNVDGPLGDRYAIQAARALISLGDYDRLLSLAQEHKFSDAYLEYQMQGYKASALCRFERYEEALDIYQRHNDILSIEWMLKKLDKYTTPLDVWYEASKDPSNYVMVCKGLESYFKGLELNHEGQAWDEGPFRPRELAAAIATARRGAALNNALKPVWQYTEAYAYILATNDFARADSVLSRITGANPFLNDQIRALRFNTLAALKPYGPAYLQWLMQECDWLIAKGDKIYAKAMADVKADRCEDYRYLCVTSARNYHRSLIYYSDVMHRAIDTSVVPRMLEHGDTVKALQMLDVVDFCNLGSRADIGDESYTHGTASICFALEHGPDVISAALSSGDGVAKLWRRHGSIRNADRWADLLGTALLSRGRYKEAVKTLSAVSVKYAADRSTHEHYTHRNPFSAKFLVDDQCHEPSTFMEVKPYYYKLWFAKQMAALEDTMANPKLDADDRADALVKYGIGMINSVYPCWSLTQYGYGDSPYAPYSDPHDTPYPWADQWHPSDYIDQFICYEYNTCYIGRHDMFMRNFQDQLYLLKLRGEDCLNEGLSNFTDKERHAHWLYVMGKYAAIKADFADTNTGRFVKASCDNWRHWR